MAHPADVLKLEKKMWKLDTPLLKDGATHDIHDPRGESRPVKWPEIATFEDKDKVTNTHKGCFFVTDGDGVVMRVHHGSPSTKSSWNPRCELQDMTATWAGDKHGTHTLTVVGKVNRLTKTTKTVVLAQVHGKKDDVTVFRLEDTNLYVTEGDKVKHLVAKDFALGKRYTLKIEVKDGKTKYWYNNRQVGPVTDNSDPKNFFKAGNYLQSNLNKDSHEYAPHEPTSEYSEVVLYSVEVSHESGGHH
jgi:hypothetical protein